MSPRKRSTAHTRQEHEQLPSAPTLVPQALRGPPRNPTASARGVISTHMKGCEAGCKLSSRLSCVPALGSESRPPSHTVNLNTEQLLDIRGEPLNNTWCISSRHGTRMPLNALKLACPLCALPRHLPPLFQNAQG